MVLDWGRLGFWRRWLGETSPEMAIRRDWPPLAALAVGGCWWRVGAPRWRPRRGRVLTRALRSARFAALCPVRRTRSCLLYTSDAADERSSVDLGGRRI